MSPPAAIPFLSEEDLAALHITARDAVALIERLIRGRAAPTVWSAPKASIAVPDDRFVMSTLAIADDPPYVAVKSLLLNPRNPARGQPLMNSIVTLQDSETGLPCAVLDGNWVTAVRTAALSAVAARHMARTDARTIAFVGCGLQARSHLGAFAEFFPLERIKAFGRGRANIDALCEAAADRGLAAEVATNIEDALAEADLVVSSITRKPGLEPFVDATHLRPGAFAAVTDLAAPWRPASLTAFDRIVIDDLAQEAVMKDKLVSPELVTGDLAGLVLDEIPGRRGDDERTAFICRGYALGDFALAALAYDKWKALR